MGFEDQFDKIDKLLSIVPLTNLKCPECKTSNEEHFSLLYDLRYGCPIDADGPTKIIKPDYSNEDFVEQIGHPTLFCDKCGTESPLPDGWRIHVPKTNSERPGTTKPADRITKCSVCGFDISEYTVLPDSGVCVLCEEEVPPNDGYVKEPQRGGG